MSTAVAVDDVAGTGEEEFEVGMRHHAMEFDAGDVDHDESLDFDEFCKMVRRWTESSLCFCAVNHLSSSVSTGAREGDG
jgi:hypothetical protein